MKRVGILTFHSSLNYGGVLQAWALQNAIGTLGYQVWILDRWFRSDNKLLLGPFGKERLCERLCFCVRGILGGGQFAYALRHWRTIEFIKKHLNRTAFHFVEWGEAKEELKAFEVVVVGSDQVWHCGDWGNPKPFLLIDAPQHLKAISYAASFGMAELPKEWEAVFCAGLKKFAAISVRELEGLEITRRLGVDATYVLDPTQLVPAQTWNDRLCLKRSPSDRLVCYFLEEDYLGDWEMLEAFARQMKCGVDIYVNGVASVEGRISALLSHAVTVLRHCSSPVRVCFGAGPREFLEAVYNAKWIVSDSFHALMFASIFTKNIRIIIPKTEERKRMFGRIQNFADRFVHGPLLSNSLHMALHSFYKGETITFDNDGLQKERMRSYEWLKSALTHV